MYLGIVLARPASDLVKSTRGERKRISNSTEDQQARSHVRQEYSLDMFPAFVISRENRHPVRLVVPKHCLVQDRHRDGTKEVAAGIDACECAQCSRAGDEFADDGDQFHW